MLKLSMFLLLSTAAVGIAPPARAADNATDAIRLEAQPMADALRRIAAATGTTVRFDPSVVARLRSNPVDAATPREAIAQAIAGTSLTVSGSAAGGFLVAGNGVAMTSDGDIVVTARRDEAETRYLVQTTASSTRDGKTLRDQPQSTTVISDRLMSDQQVQTIAQALRNAAGATVNLGNVQGAPSYTVRGFFAQPLTGGLSDPAGGLSQPVANVERVEVLKGPAALLAGADNLGGSVNIVTKKPIAQPLLNLTVENGSFDDWRVIVDGSTALDPDKKVSARLVAQYARADHNAGYYDGRFENLVAPSLRYKDAALDVTAGVELSDVRSPAAPYGAFNAAGQLIDLSRASVGPRNSGFRLQTERYYYDGRWTVTPWLTLVSRSQLSIVDTDIDIYGLAANLAPDLALLLKTDERQHSRTIATDDYARFAFRTGPFRHTLSAGFNYSDYSVDDRVPVQPNGVVVGDLFGPVPLTYEPFYPAVVPNYTAGSRQYGYYAQDLIEIGPLHVIGAVRQNRYISVSDVPGAGSSRYEKSSLTPQGGAVLDLTHRLSIYANYVEGFMPSFLLDRSAQLLPPQRTRNIEAGAKWDVVPDRLAFTASAFRIRQSNVPVAIPGLRNRYGVIAGEEARGIEADLTGQVLPGWNVAANYSYATYKILEPTDFQRVVPGQPEHKYSVFSRYTVLHGPLKDLGGSFGVYGFSSSQTTQAGGIILPAQTDVATNLYYKIGRFNLNAGIDNLLDKKVYGVTQTSTYVPLNPTRTYRVTLSYAFF